MKCSRITLTDRKDIPSRQIPKRSCIYPRVYQPQLHNYASWLNKPRPIYCEDKPLLTVYNLALPKNVVTIVDRGAQSERWIKKRPRLQSAKLKTSKSKPKTIETNESAKEAETIKEDNVDSEIMEIQQVMQEYEIDEHVKRLIQQAAEHDLRNGVHPGGSECGPEDAAAYEFAKRRHKKSAKHRMVELELGAKEKPRPKLSRKITLSYSRPASPQTVQVIRVDVTSNYSMDEAEYSDVGMERTQEQPAGNSIKLEKNQSANRTSNRLQKQKSLIRDVKCPELTRHCQKLAVSGRKINGIL